MVLRAYFSFAYVKFVHHHASNLLTGTTIGEIHLFLPAQFCYITLSCVRSSYIDVSRRFVTRYETMPCNFEVFALENCCNIAIPIILIIPQELLLVVTRKPCADYQITRKPNIVEYIYMVTAMSA
jgi:hypothetical protein